MDLESEGCVKGAGFVLVGRAAGMLSLAMHGVKAALVSHLLAEWTLTSRAMAVIE